MKKKTAAESIFEQQAKINAALVQTKPEEVLNEENMSLGAIIGFIFGGGPVSAIIGGALAAKYDRYVDEWSMAHADLAPDIGEIGITFVPGTTRTGAVFSEVKIQQHNEKGFSIVDFLDEHSFNNTSVGQITQRLRTNPFKSIKPTGIRVRTGFIVPVSDNAREECLNRVQQCSKYVRERVMEDLNSAGKVVGQGIRNIGKRFSRPKTTVAPHPVIATENLDEGLGLNTGSLGALGLFALSAMGTGPVGLVAALTTIVAGLIIDASDSYNARRQYEAKVYPFLNAIDKVIKKNKLEHSLSITPYERSRKIIVKSHDERNYLKITVSAGDNLHDNERYDSGYIESPTDSGYHQNFNFRGDAKDNITLHTIVIKAESSYPTHKTFNNKGDQITVYGKSSCEGTIDDYEEVLNFIIKFLDKEADRLRKPAPSVLDDHFESKKISSKKNKLIEKNPFKRSDKDYNREFKQVVTGVVNDFKGMSVKVELEEPGVASILKLMFKGEELATAKMNISGEKITLDCEAPGFFNKITGKKSDWIIPKDSTPAKIIKGEDGKSLVQKYRYHLKQKLETVYKDGGNKKAKKKEEPAAEEPKSEVKENKWLNRQLRQESKALIKEAPSWGTYLRGGTYKNLDQFLEDVQKVIISSKAHKGILNYINHMKQEYKELQRNKRAYDQFYSERKYENHRNLYLGIKDYDWITKNYFLRFNVTCFKVDIEIWGNGQLINFTMDFSDWRNKKLSPYHTDFYSLNHRHAVKYFYDMILSDKKEKDSKKRKIPIFLKNLKETLDSIDLKPIESMYAYKINSIRDIPNMVKAADEEAKNNFKV